MHKVLIVLIKDLLVRRNNWIQTALEVILPIGIIILLNLTPFPQPDPPYNEYFNDTIFKSCDQRLGDLYMEVLYEPSNNFTNALMSNVKCFGGFQDVKAGSIHKSDSIFKVGVIFKGLNHTDTAVPHDLDYELWPATNYWASNHEWWSDPTGQRYIYTSGPLKKFLRLQHAIDESFVKMKNFSVPKVSFQNMDLISRSPRIHTIVVMAAFVFGFSLMVPGVVGNLVQEKFTGAKELILIMGLKKWHLWLSKLLDCLIVIGIVQFFNVLFLYVPLTESSTVLSTVPPFMMWAYLVYTILGVIIFHFFLSCFFNNSTLAVYITQIVWGFSFILFIILSIYSAEVSRTVWITSCLLPHFCFFLGLSILLDFDYYQKSVKVGEILSGQLSYPPLSNVLVMAAVDVILYSVFTWYLEQVNPGKFGIPKPYDFCFKKSFSYPQNLISASNSAPKSERQNTDFETVPNGMRVGISISNLSKEYKSLAKGSVVAVDNISIDFYSGEISALLGHNGAGKTTVFSVISGLTYATSGKVIINGHDVAEETDEARESLGLCLQQDMLFQDLDVRQILCFFGMIKGLSMREAKKEAKEFIRKLKLNDVENTCAIKLSGGQKRKVSLAIALIGGSKVVLLDEPTSGLDPEIRREIWEILLEFRGTRTILLTTHFMEEADAVSDRIAIMDHGKIKCYGSPMYLKSKYGSGYTLSVVAKHIGKCRDVTELVQKSVSSARLKCQNVLTLTYQLPQEEVARFPIVLAGLNEMQNSGEIHSYSISFSTFEDVFIRLRGKECENDTAIDVVDSNSPYRRLNCSDEAHSSKINDFLLPFYQFYALIIKKFIYFRRNIRSYLIFSAIPLVFLIVNFLILPAVVSKIPEPHGVNEDAVKGSFRYSLQPYSDSVVLYSVSSHDKLSESFAKYISKHGSNVIRVENIDIEVERIFKENFYTYMRNTILGAEFGREEVTIHHNSRAVHILPVSLNVLYNSILLANNISGEIKTSVNLKYSDREKKALLNFANNMQDPLTSCFLAEIPDYIGIQIIFYLMGPMKEKFYNAKHLQLMSTSTILYWLSHLFFDVASFIIYLLMCLLIIGFSKQDDMFMENIGEVVFGVILWGMGLIILTYIVSSFMKNFGAASAITLTVYCICTFLVYNLVRWGVWAEGVQYIHPSSILKMGLNNICLEERGNYKTALVIYNFVLFVILILKDSHIFSTVIHRVLSRTFHVDYSDLTEEDAAVKEHEEHVRKLRNRKELSPNSMIIDGLKRWHLKRLRPMPTVKGISFAVNNGECFGLLGVNGAGKTTTFKMITGNIPASQGHVFVNGYNLFSPIEKSRGLLEIGYCPQYGGFIPTFKAKELLALFARLRGVQGSHVTKETAKWIEELDLKEHIDTPVENYSGGNQRKLLVGIALIGNSNVVFLDEPTSGVDPVSRRIIWKAIANLRTEGKSVLLTSHSMDECEAVCTRLAIMVKGRFRCLGEITTLKDTFGQGFTVQLKVCSDTKPEEFQAIKEAMSSEFDPGCDLTDEHLTILEYHITNRSIKWDTLFMKLLLLEERFDKLESFNASATTLEQIFISFARNQ